MMTSDLNKLPWRADEEGQGVWIYAEDYHKFLLSSKQPGDVLTTKKYNLVHEIQGHKGGLKRINGQEAISKLSVVRHVFNHMDQMNTLKNIAHSIIHEHVQVDSTPENQEQETIFNLYKQVAKQPFSKLKNSLSELKDIPFNNTNIPTLVSDFKQYFLVNEWQSIQFFEWHYSLQCDDNSDLSNHLEQCQKKWQYFQYCMQVSNVARKMQKENPKVILRRKQRSEAAQQLAEVATVAAVQHRPQKIEQSILSAITECSTVEAKVIVMEHSLTADENSVDIAVEINQLEANTVDFLVNCISGLCSKDHTINCRKIYFVEIGTFDTFKQHGDFVQRFALSDSLTQRDTLTSVWHVVEMNASSEDNADLVEEGERLCKSCYNHELPLPLSASSFDLRNEWAMDVPLPIQLLLEGFINENTIKKLSSDSHHKYLQKHTERLYLLYDTLLNTFNSYHHGLMQKVITDNLIMNFHSISSLLELTNKAGLTTSYKTAETTVQTRAQENTRNYETFLKTYPLMYKTIAGMITNHVNLRQCHPILMLDNLVRLKTKEDPDPGESRTKQICTLPITLQGLPKDHIITESWHDANICDATPACACKKELQLTPDDVESALLTLTDEENRCISKTQNLMRFGCASLWQKIQSHIHDLRSASKNSDNPGLETANEDENYGDEHLNAYIAMLADSESIDDLMTSFEVNCTIEDSSGIDASDTDNTSAEEISSCSQEITKHELQQSQHTILETFGLRKTNAPELLTRRPPPVAGRDDDITKLKEILDDMLLKLGYNNAHGHSDRILCGPDNKICSNLLTLMERDKKYKAFLPEFPILHLRKSKINTILSAYKDSGFGQLLRFMRDESSQELSKIIGLHHIDVATRHIKRLGQSLHVAFLVKFLEQLSEEDQSSLLDVLSGKSVMNHGVLS